MPFTVSQVYSMDPELPAEVIDAVFKAGDAVPLPSFYAQPRFRLCFPMHRA